jgi:GNAT superfamily N-acetyltransferase
MASETGMELVDVIVCYLEMFECPDRTVPSPREGLTVVHAKKPTVGYYRFIYEAVGADYHWFSRRIMSDQELTDLIHDPLVEVHVLYVDGTPAGYVEIDRRQPNEVEIPQFGLTADFIGQGLGKWFLRWTIERIFSYGIGRLWLHTCSLDHPIALENYKKAGFVEYKQEQIHRQL